MFIYLILSILLFLMIFDNLQYTPSTTPMDKCAIVGLIRRDPPFESVIERNRLIKKYIEKYHSESYSAPIDLLIFHEGDITKEEQDHIVKSGGIECQFVDISDIIPDWSGQCCLKCGEYDDGPWNMGYCNMCRFYFCELAKICKDRGYEYFMRLDDDSMLNSSKYDVFRYLKDHEADYGYCDGDAPEYHQPTLATLPSFVKKYVSENPNDTNSLVNIDENDTRQYYNNFCVIRTDWWMQPKVQKFVEEVKESDGLYRYRWGDAPLQRFTLEIFDAKCLKVKGLNYHHGSHSRTIETFQIENHNESKSKIKPEHCGDFSNQKNKENFNFYIFTYPFKYKLN